MPEYRCTTMCFHTVDTGRGVKHRLFKVGDILSVPESTEVPDHFVLATKYTEPEGPRHSGESAERYSKRQFPSLIAPVDEVKVKRAKAAAQKEKVPGGSKDKSERVDRY